MKRKRICRTCGAKMTTRIVDRPYPECGVDDIVLGGVTVHRCTRGHEDLRLRDVVGLHHAIACDVARRDGRLLPKEIRFLRSALDYSVGGFAESLGVSRETVSRWESTRSAQPMTVAIERLLRLMVLTDTRIDEAEFDRPRRPAVLRQTGGWKVAG